MLLLTRTLLNALQTCSFGLFSERSLCCCVIPMMDRQLYRRNQECFLYNYLQHTLLTVYHFWIITYAEFEYTKTF